MIVICGYGYCLTIVIYIYSFTAFGTADLDGFLSPHFTVYIVVLYAELHDSQNLDDDIQVITNLIILKPTYFEKCL